MHPERRKYVRFIPIDNAFAALGNDFNRIGKIKDISMGGLAFEYISDKGSQADCSLIDIFLSGNGFHMSGVPCRQVMNVPITKTDLASGMVFLIRKRCNVQFGELSNEHAAQLNDFLRFHIKGLLPGKRNEEV